METAENPQQTFMLWVFFPFFTEKQIKKALVGFLSFAELLQTATNMCKFHYRSLWQVSPVSHSALTALALPVGIKELHKSRDLTCMFSSAMTLSPLQDLLETISKFLERKKKKQQTSPSYIE